MVCYLNVYSSPSGAEVRIDGSYKGTTPIYNIPMASGYYDIDIRKTGYVPYIYLNYYISPTDLVKNISVTLTPEAEQFAWLTIKSNPSGATVYIDGSNKGTEPYTSKQTPLSKHDIELRKSGYNDFIYDNYTWPAAGVTKTVTFDLSPLVVRWRNSIQWESYESSGGTWYLHTLYGKKVGDIFNFFVSSSIAYINHPKGTYTPNIDITIPSGTTPGTYDAWTVISTTNTPSQIGGANIIAQKFDLNAITI